MNKIRTYIANTTDELINKVSWPTWNELQNSTIVVFVATIIIAILVYIMDTVFSSILEMYYNMF